MEVIGLLLNSNKNYNDILRIIAKKYHGPQKEYSPKLWKMDRDQCQEEYLRVGKILMDKGQEHCDILNPLRNNDQELKRLMTIHKYDILVNNGNGCQKEIHDRVREINAPFKARYEEFKKSVEEELGYTHEECREMRIIKEKELRETGSKQQIRKNKITKEIKELENERYETERNTKQSQYNIDELNRMLQVEKFPKETIKTIKKQIKEEEKKVKKNTKMIETTIPTKIEKKTNTLNKIKIPKKK